MKTDDELQITIVILLYRFIILHWRKNKSYINLLVLLDRCYSTLLNSKYLHIFIRLFDIYCVVQPSVHLYIYIILYAFRILITPQS